MLVVPDHLRMAMHDHERKWAPTEAAGLCAVSGDAIMDFYPVVNQDGSEWSYSIAGRDLLRAADAAEEKGWSVGAVVHSHPSTDPWPSDVDVASAPASDWFYLITSRGRLGAFRIVGGRVRRLQVTPSPTR